MKCLIIILRCLIQMVLLLEPPYILQGRAAPLQEGSGTGGSGVRSAAVLSCPNCPKIFSGPGRHQLYERHVIVHTGERPYNCPHCTYRANQLSNLRRHIKSIHHGQTQSGNNLHQGQHFGSTVHQGHIARDINQQVVALMPHNQNLSSRSIEEQQFTTSSSSSFQHQYSRESFEGSVGPRH